MAGLFQDYLFGPDAYSGGLLTGLNQGPQVSAPGVPAWLPLLYQNLQQGGSDMLMGQRPPQFPNMGAQYGQSPVAPGQPQQPPQMPPAPQEDAIPPMARPMSGAMPPSLAGAPTMPDSSPGIGDRLGAGFQGFANSKGLLPAISNLVGGLATGQRGDPTGILLQQQDATHRALIASGVPPAIAKAAALNPDVMKTIASTYFETKPVELGTDPLTGQKSFGIYDPNTHSIKPLTYKTASGDDGGNSIDAINKAVQAGVSGPDLYQYLPAAMRKTVQAMIEGRMPLPSTVAMRSPATMALINAANSIDPSFDATTWKARAQMATDLAKSAPASAGGQIQFARTSINHLADVAEKADALKNLDWGITPLSNAINSIRGMGTEQAAKINALQAAVQHYGQEITKFYAGSPGGEAERNRFLQSISAAKTPQELAAAIDAERQLIPGRLGELENRIGSTMGPMGGSKYPVHSDQSKASLDKIDTVVGKMRSPGGQSAAAPAAPGAQSAPQGPPSGAVQALKQNPKLADQFDAKYGVGASARALGMQ